jgi:hypothetical protein
LLLSLAVVRTRRWEREGWGGGGGRFCNGFLSPRYDDGVQEGRDRGEVEERLFEGRYREVPEYLARMGKVRWVYSVGDAYGCFDWLWGGEMERSLELWWVVQ